MNKVILIGRLVKDIEPKYSSNGNMWLSNTLAVDRKFEKDKTDFINIKAFNKTAEFIEKYLKKGSKIAIVGELRVNTYETENGKRTSTEVIVNEIDFAGGKASENIGDMKYENDDVSLEELENADVPF